MKNHTDLINLIAKKINAKTYLEIGVYNPDHNFNKIEVNDKISVDPDINAGAMIRMESDNFFKWFDFKIDLGFVDGLHHSDQAKRDIANIYQRLNPGGVIVIHDCNPHSESITHVPRVSKEWTGDVYKIVSQIQSNKFTVNFDYGCCVIRKIHAGTLLIFDHNLDVTWQQFDYSREKFLNLVNEETALAWINDWNYKVFYNKEYQNI